MRARSQSSRAICSGCDNAFSPNFLGDELARRIPEIEPYTAGQIAFNSDPMSFAGEQHLRFLLLDRERLRNLFDRHHGFCTVSESGHDRTRSSQNIENHAYRMAKIALPHALQLAWTQNHIDSAFHNLSFLLWNAGRRCA